MIKQVFADDGADVDRRGVQLKAAAASAGHLHPLDAVGQCLGAPCFDRLGQTAEPVAGGDKILPLLAVIERLSVSFDGACQAVERLA